jgi:hypothetical protein
MPEKKTRVHDAFIFVPLSANMGLQEALDRRVLETETPLHDRRIS